MVGTVVACDDRSVTRPTSTEGSPLTVPVRRLYRDPGNRLVAGVASGIAGHLGLSPFAVRLSFIALLPFSGLGALLYAVF